MSPLLSSEFACPISLLHAIAGFGHVRLSSALPLRLRQIDARTWTSLTAGPALSTPSALVGAHNRLYLHPVVTTHDTSTRPRSDLKTIQIAPPCATTRADVHTSRDQGTARMDFFDR